jgi:isopentenyl phosphate kinase
MNSAVRLNLSSRTTETARRLQAIVLVAVAAIVLGGCGAFGHEPAKKVTIEINEISAEADRDEVKETLKGMTDGSSHLMTSFSTGDQMTVELSPVSDVDAFSRKINFGEVTEVKDRTVKVTFVK